MHLVGAGVGAALRGDQSPPSASDLLPILASWLPQVTTQELPGLGHMAPVTPPERVNSLIVDFYQRQGCRRPAGIGQMALCLMARSCATHSSAPTSTLIIAVRISSATDEPLGGP